jgi:uncharacterized membrane protein YphA (DoxX/SURF4 family)
MATRTTTVRTIRTTDDDPRYRRTEVVRTTADRAVRPAYQILMFAFIVLPVVAGLDKFFQRLADWSDYLAPQIAGRLPVAPRDFMHGVGIVEVVAGLLVAIKPSVGGVVVALWLWGIIVNLLVSGAHYDIALRDFGLSLGALALARLAHAFHR